MRAHAMTRDDAITITPVKVHPAAGSQRVRALYPPRGIGRAAAARLCHCAVSTHRRGACAPPRSHVDPRSPSRMLPSQRATTSSRISCCPSLAPSLPACQSCPLFSSLARPASSHFPWPCSPPSPPSPSPSSPSLWGPPSSPALWPASTPCQSTEDGSMGGGEGGVHCMLGSAWCHTIGVWLEAVTLRTLHSIA